MFVLGKIEPLCRIFTVAGMIVEKNHPPRLHIATCNVELLSLPSRPSGTSAIRIDSPYAARTAKCNGAFCQSRGCAAIEAPPPEV
jgi:hypothetical protein